MYICSQIAANSFPLTESKQFNSLLSFRPVSVSLIGSVSANKILYLFLVFAEVVDNLVILIPTSLIFKGCIAMPSIFSLEKAYFCMCVCVKCRD